MTPDEVLSIRPKVLSERQRPSYFQDGYLLLERLCAATERVLEASRPLLLNIYAAADAFRYTHNPLQSMYDQAILRGRAVRWAHHDPRPCLMPPDWSGGYTSTFALQQEETWDAAQ